MDAKRLRLKRITTLLVLLLMLGTLLSFFIAPRVADANTREDLGLSEDAFVTDTARSPWVYVNEEGEATLYGDRMIGKKTLRIPDAVNGVLLKRVLHVHTKPKSVETVVFSSSVSVSKSLGYFREWTGLKTLAFEEGTTDLSGVSVHSMPALKEIYLPADITKISASFLKQEGVTVFFAGSEEEWLAIGKNAKTLLTKHTVVFDTPVPSFDEK
ncbi:MAG: hypothetical protein E7609_06250 [Ruminococcaceae bacterium]|nr:hypothetical protein [Oscillospiraceae bacterium]